MVQCRIVRRGSHGRWISHIHGHVHENHRALVSRLSRAIGHPERIFSHNEISGVTVVKLDKPCCAGLQDCVFRAAGMRHLPVPINVTCIFTDAEEAD